MNKHRSQSWFLLALAPATALLAQPATSIEDRLARLEDSIARLEKHASQTVTTDELAPTLREFSDLTRALNWDGKSQITAVKPAGKETNLALGGFVQAQFESGTAPDARFASLTDRFVLRRARLYATGAFAENMSFKFESDFGNNSIAAKTGLAGQLTDAYVTWSKYPAANVRVGQFKTPFGFEQLASDTKIYTIERSLPNDRLTLGRQIGAGLFGDLPGKRFGYSVAAYNGTGTNIGSNDSQKFLWVGRATAVAFEGKLGEQKAKFTTGVNYFTTVDKGTFTGRRNGTGVDAQFAVGPGEIQAEWLRNDQHPSVGRPTAANGWALLTAVNLTKQWQGVVRFETYDSNTATGNTTSNLWTYGVNYLLKGDDLKLSLDYLSGSLPAPTPLGVRIFGRLQVLF